MEAIGRGEVDAKIKKAANLIENADIDSGHESDSTVCSVISLEDDSVVDVSGQNLEISLLDNADDAKGLYLFRNVFNLIPKSIGELGRLRKLKFFGNEIDLFPPELGNLVDLEYLQVKISSPGFGDGLSWDKLKGLKELELTKVPKRSSALTLLSQISGLKFLTRLSVCRFSIRYLPAEIGCLKSLEDLDLSFNKIKSLPNEISYLSSLMFLKVAHNRLMELPPVLALLQNLESLDVSNNRLTTLDPLDLSLMPRLQILNLQFNKLSSYCSIPTWIQCNLEGNYEEMGVDICSSSMVEMDVYETPYENSAKSVPVKGSHRNPLNMSTGVSSISRCFSARKSSKRWKRRQHYFQQRARQERLNNSRKWKGEVLPEGLSLKMDIVEEIRKQGTAVPHNSDKGSVGSICLDDNDKLLEEAERGDSVITSEEEESSLKANFDSDNSRCVKTQSERDNNKSCEIKASSPSSEDTLGTADYNSSTDRKKPKQKSKRSSEKYLDNPKGSKCHRPSTDIANLSQKYSRNSFCSTEDSLPDGFFDAGRDRPFMPLSRYEEILPLDSREVILLDRAKDEVLDAITLSARSLVARLKKVNCITADVDQVSIDNLQVASFLALFVSDHFGGSDRTAIIERTRKAVSGTNYQKPFICTCLTGNQDNLAALNKRVSTTAEDVILSDVCDKSLRSIKSKRNSIVVPLGKLQFGICRHRALLMKYLCDRMEPPIPCELVRGYLDFMPHAWNIVPVKQGSSWVRMVVDACRPHDIREDTDQEYFCRYIPLNRINESIRTRENLEPGCSFSSLSTGKGVERANSSLIRCKLGSTEAVVKMRTLEVSGAFSDDIRTFEYTCLGEVRILGSLKHDCIVELYGHEISSKWITTENGNEHRRILQSSILMEHIKGGSLKGHIEKLSEAGKHHVPLDLALSIARDISGALMELHSKDILHRDIKSENVLIDLDNQRANEGPIVKLCDFDRAVPLRSHLHGCCIAHVGIPPPNTCVGTPRWMSPEVFRAMHEQNFYGLEVDIWSFGCLIFELLTLEIPYFNSSELQIHESLQKGKRPKLPEKLETLSSETEEEDKLREELDLTESDLDTMRFLINVFHCCTEESPLDRPNARDLHEMILSQTKSKSPSGASTSSQSSIL
ncbi:Serine/threonine-protein kinase STY13 [Cardamine amara subsp. amara]|uniref:Serine/threonine-protein kinase STY13 n=1 Tax=Cardamine amara subsp. amara TaxID=228776 RepID=A0ABD0ZQF3_CARAN